VKLTTRFHLAPKLMRRAMPALTKTSSWREAGLSPGTTFSFTLTY